MLIYEAHDLLIKMWQDEVTKAIQSQGIHKASGPKEGPCALRVRQAATLDNGGAGDGGPILVHEGWVLFGRMKEY